MLERDRTNRPSAREALQHPFFKKDKELIQKCLYINRELKTQLTDFDEYEEEKKEKGGHDLVRRKETDKTIYTK